MHAKLFDLVIELDRLILNLPFELSEFMLKLGHRNFLRMLGRYSLQVIIPFGEWRPVIRGAVT